MTLIDRNDAVLVFIDVQGKLAESMTQRDQLYRNLQTLIRGARALDLPVLWTEQVPEKLGATIAPLRELLEGLEPISKKTFSCAGEPRFLESLAALGRRSVILCGIEAHVCVYQTALDLLAHRFRVELVTDAVSSRHAVDLQAAIGRIGKAGAGCLTVEMLLFEMQGIAEGETFRQLIQLVKSR